MPLAPFSRKSLFFTLLFTFASAALADDAAFQRATEFRDAGELRSAVIAIKDLLQGDPSDGQARVLLGRVYLDLGDGVAAEQAFARALAAGVPRQPLLEPLGEALLFQMHFRRLLDEIMPVVSLDQRQKAAIHTLRGEAYLGLGQRDQAAGAFELALSLAPSHERALLGAARVAGMQRKPDEARGLIQGVLDANPSSPLALEALGDLDYLQGRNAEGAAAFTAALEQSRHKWRLYQKRAVARLDAGDLEGAGKDIEAAEEASPRMAGLLYPRGLLFFKEGKLDEALAQFQGLLRSFPEHPQGMYYAGATLFRLNRYLEAEEYLSRFQRLAPGSLMGALLLGRNRLAAGKPVEAEQGLSPFAAREDAGSELLLLASKALAEQGRFAQAGELLQRVIAREPDNEDVRLALAEQLILAGDREAASNELDALVKGGSADRRAHLLLLKIHLEQGDQAAALTDADALLALDPASAAAHNGRGLALLLVGDEAGARAAFAAALEAQPGFWDASSNLARLDLSAGNQEAARALYEGVLEQHPANSNAALALASLDMAAGDSAAARQRLAAMLEQNRDALDVRLALIKYHLQNKDPAAARSLVEEGPKDLDGNASFLLWKGQVEYANRAFSDAAATFGQLARLRPQSGAARFLLAETQAAANYISAMQDALLDGLELEPAHPLSGPAIRVVTAAMPDVASRRSLLLRVRSLAPDHPELDVLAGNIAFESGDWVDAIDAFRGAYEKVPEERGGFLRLYRAQVRGSRYDDAVKDAEGWLNRHPDDAEVWVMVGEVKQYRRDSAGAVQAYGRAIEAAPENLAALNNLAMLLVDDEPERALGFASRAHHLAPGNPAVADTLGTALLRNGELERAATILGEAHKGLPADASVSYRYASALAQIGRGAEAGKILKLLKFQRAHFPEKAQADALLESLSK